LSYPSGREAKFAGAALFVGVVQFALAMLLAEFLYPGYSVSGNAISDLGATCSNGACQILQPTSTIFNLSIIIAGVLVLVSGFYLRRAVRAKILVACILIAGAAMIGVGVFPETFGVVHGIVSLITFLFISFAAISAYKIERAPLSYFSVLLGIISLVATGLFTGGVYLGLGEGGMERMIVYPVLLWSIAFSGQLITEGQSY
jgi:hypothetical membrane protein